MNVSLQNLSPALASTAITGSAPASSSGFADAGFTNAIRAAINTVEASQAQSQSSASQFLINGQGDVHTVALAAQDAELSLELFQQVRNKFVSAYQEIMKMPM